MVIITILVFAFIPLMSGFIIYISLHPEIGKKMGILATKAELFSMSDWKGYLEILNQAFAAIGLIGFGFITTWVFGREYTDRTMKDLLALPVSRNKVVSAKYLVILIWCLILVLVFLLSGLLTGKIIEIPDWSIETFINFIKILFGVSFLSILLISPVSFLTNLSKGLMAPLGFIIITVILAQFSGVLGLAPYFPWSIPGVLTIHDVDSMSLNIYSFFILFLTSFAGFGATYAFWYMADHH